ncbi:MAG: WG repeat-containing protein [Armatimonadota bacterium]
MENKWGFVDKTGNLTVLLKYSEVNIFKEGLARVKK